MRWFAESVWYPTALLPSQGVVRTLVDATSARATMVDGPLSLTLLCRFGTDGLIRSFHADACAATVDRVAVMLPWECRISGRRSVGGMLVPMTGEVLYLTRRGEQSYFRGAVARIGYTVY
ncbi:hypothetical protein CHU95_03895 [Niveispirillum lacus]|uniref:Uncharacterized protein n=1 Tax=Niveispirillum lacus TaxID=1981099 RepID=A0A255Z5K4_9PROT|nr:DUF6544 family protein [Niveispirillum lacus]OYQ36711.1 hypothetical protein CHU95_03895 [Niveispirillum lacus]